MSEYDNTGTAAAWKVDSTNPKAPKLRATCYAHRDLKAGEKFEISLFANATDNPKAPVLKGKVQDPYQGAAQPAQAESAAPSYDDSLPF